MTIMNFNLARIVTAATIALPFCHLAASGTNDVLRTVADINTVLERSDAAGISYDVTAKMVLKPRFSPRNLSFYASDSTGTALFGMEPVIHPSIPTNIGDIMRIKGIIIPTMDGKLGLHSQQVTLIAHGEPLVPVSISAMDIYDGDKLKNNFVRISGIVHDAFRDEIDNLWSYLILNCDGTLVYVALLSDGTPPDILEQLIGANISVKGIVSNNLHGSRIALKRYICATGLDSIKILSPKTADPFAVPSYSSAPFPVSAHPAVLTRRRTAGHVIAVWDNGENILLKSDEGDLVRIDLKSHKPPKYGDHIEVAGFPATDLYRRNLSRAIWRSTPGKPFVEESPKLMQAKDIFTDTEGQPIKEAKLYGRAITLFGIVRGLSPVGTNSLRLYLECDSFMVTIDVSSCPEMLKHVSIGCTLSVSGTYIIKADNWRSNNVFPQIREILVAIRKSDDIKIIARPPWWTTGRLLAVIGGLIASLFAIFGWNIALRRRAERRGKELAAEQVAHVTSELKVYERTRLAVELHDSLSQTLTGVSMGIDTAIDLANNMPQNLKRQLEYTSKTVETCRTELRNCLWDLRSEALEATTMNDAIKRSLGQIVNHTSLAVRFNVPRARLSDKTTHMILRIIRELSSNAIRHGNASQLLIAGCIDGDSLHFSVKDNGTGFDPMNTPGVSDGHFGLQGIQERLDLIDGEMKIESAKDRNTKVTVTIKIPGKRKTSGEDINE